MMPVPHADRDRSEAPRSVYPDPVLRQIDSLITERDELEAANSRWQHRCLEAQRERDDLRDERTRQVWKHRAEKAETKVERVEAALATLDEVAYLQIGVEKMLTVQPTGRYRAAVPPHWRDEVEQRVHPFREVLRAALEGES